MNFTKFGVVLLLFIINWKKIDSQNQVPRYISMTSNTNGFYEYLPAGYSGSNESYPLIIFIHGYGDLGNGSPSELPRVLRNALPKIIHEGDFPESFSVGGQTHRFIVLSPQFLSWPQPSQIKGVIDYAVQNYRVNSNRIYITGTSMGGGVTWEYAGASLTFAQRVAAIVPVCGASDPNYTRGRNIANADLAVWATHNNNDPIVTVNNTNTYIQYINEAPAPTPAAKKTIFNNNTHDAWTVTYDPNWQQNGLNIYEWMLQYQRNFTILPVTLEYFNVEKLNANQIKIEWKTTSETSNSHFILERSTDGLNFTEISTFPASTNGLYRFIDSALTSGIHYYRLKQFDIDGRITIYPVKQARINFGEQQIKLYPVPASDYINLNMVFENPEIITVSLINSSGVNMFSFNTSTSVGNFNKRIELKTFTPGIYVLKIQAETFNYSRSFIKH